MQEHRGEIVKRIAEKSGYTLKALADRLDISRGTIYRKFGEHNLSYEFIARVGDVIHYDFSVDFPEIKSRFDLLDEEAQKIELQHLERKYVRLLKNYDRLLTFLVGLARDHHLRKLKREIDDVLEAKR